MSIILKAFADCDAFQYVQYNVVECVCSYIWFWFVFSFTTVAAFLHLTSPSMCLCLFFISVSISAHQHLQGVLYFLPTNDVTVYYVYIVNRTIFSYATYIAYSHVR